MHDITFRYKTSSKAKKVEEVHLKVAASWNELTSGQLLEIIRIQLASLPGDPKVAYHLKNLQLLKTLLGIKWVIIHQFTGVQRLGLYLLLDFLGTVGLTKQLVPLLTCRAQKTLSAEELHGPSERFRNLTFAEFIYCDTLFSFFCKTDKIIFLEKLIACLYRPQRTDYDPKSPTYKGDIRQDFNEHLIEGRLPLIEALPLHVKFAVLAWYRGCRKELEQRYDKVFTESNQIKAAEGDWGDVLLSLSGEKFGTMEQTSGQRVHTVFKEMQRQAREHEELRRQHEMNNHR
ncbi:hypothetical protein [Pontibacter kalidii]|uniref:hypothetical protein n=1 Tax=Pontibacter kalidii TaxID=2592049 RepID=UPI00224D1458|nr:hypothetical protein [Pontibacter kalidii]